MNICGDVSDIREISSLRQSSQSSVLRSGAITNLDTKVIKIKKVPPPLPSNFSPCPNILSYHQAIP